MSSKSRLPCFSATASVFHVISLFLQPVFAGMIMAGSDFDSLGFHQHNAELAFVLCLIMFISLVVSWRRRVSGLLPSIAAVAILVAEGLQMHFGYNADLLIHIPLGVFIITGSTLLSFTLVKANTMDTARHLPGD